jgi:GrpB-like predicted nucleotidyltransferase (UPF0157 family)
VRILGEVQKAEVDKQNKKLTAIDYVTKGEFGIIGRRYFHKERNSSGYHIHAFESGNPEIDRHVLFVEFMNAHPLEANKYESLKLNLAVKFRDEPDRYSDGKTKFIRNIDKKAYQWKHG